MSWLSFNTSKYPVNQVNNTEILVEIYQVYEQSKISNEPVEIILFELNRIVQKHSHRITTQQRS